ncbi:MAG: hypothetical protein NZ914_12150, partial [Gemmatales bacterium]|nr:hypothetical protein [Gemmatales bacterium]
GAVPLAATDIWWTSKTKGVNVMKKLLALLLMLVLGVAAVGCGSGDSGKPAGGGGGANTGPGTPPVGTPGK